jgi:O-antigen chain-terminating methyltransferase
MSDDFYRAFEEKLRGPRELIKSRQRVYLPFIEPLLSFYKDAKAIDLGCGRGEWLEILKESGFNGHGVDLDHTMLLACHERGLNVVVQDALSALKALPDESQTIVSGFHIAEHIQFSDLRLLIQEALRVLKPAGLLILETPNPENITVGTVDFYIDPTHQKPIPPQLLSFLPEYYGFVKVKVIRLQEDKSLANKAWTSLRDVWSGVSPDYAVVAQKTADSFLLDCTSDAFAQEYGLTLDVLVGKFDQQARQASERADSAQAQAQQASECADSAQAQARQASECADSAQARAQQASERAANAEAALVALYRSRSWRLTAPLRMAGRVIRSFFRKSKSLELVIKMQIKVLLAHASLYVNQRPKLRHAALLVLARFPAVKARLKAAAMNRSIAPTAEPAVSTDLAHLTPHARQIYADLKNTIERRQKERN